MVIQIYMSISLVKNYLDKRQEKSLKSFLGVILPRFETKVK